MKRNNKKGFTIVELVIVIAVIAILAAVLIPTFAGIIDRANESVDMQIVRQMNTILQTDEIANDKPLTVVDAQQVLAANGADDFTPADSTNVYYWVGSENRVILWNTEENKVTYPKEYEAKYASTSTPSADWSRLDTVYDESNFIEITPSENETLGSAMLNSIKDANDGSILKLPKNSEVNIGMEAYYIQSYMKNAGGTGKSLTIDLNGGKLVSDQKLILNDEDCGYYGITVPANGTLELVNGVVDITTDSSSNAALVAGTGAKLVLRDVEVKTGGAAVYPAGDASEVVIDGCSIVGGGYALGTNASQSDMIKISVKDSVLKADSTAILVNVPSDTYISNCEITGAVHALALRSGTVQIENSTLITTDTEPGIYSYKNFAEGYNFSGYWHSGNIIPAATLVLGDYAQANSNGSFSYSGDAICTLANVELKSAAPTEVPEVLLAASDPAKNVNLTYDGASVVGNVLVYGSVWNPSTDNVGVSFAHPGTITVNGTTYGAKLYYYVPAAAGTFASGEYSVSVLNKSDSEAETYDYSETVKQQIENNWAITLTEAEYKSGVIQFSSATANQVKTFSYIKADGTKVNLDEKRFNLSNIGNLSLTNSHSVAVFVKDANFLNVFKSFCVSNGITLTDAQWENAKFVIDSTANCIVDIKY